MEQIQTHSYNKKLFTGKMFKKHTLSHGKRREEITIFIGITLVEMIKYINLFNLS